MPSQVDIANLALDSINASPINSLDDSDAKSATCKRNFDAAFSILVEKDHWHFAQGRVSVAELPDAPINKWSHQYTLPADCARPIRINDCDEESWEVESGVLLTDSASPIILEYVKNSATDPNRWDASFREAFIHYLAYVYAKIFPQDKDKSAREFNEYKESLAEAMARNGQTGSPHVPRVDTLTRVRRF